MLYNPKEESHPRDLNGFTQEEVMFIRKALDHFQQVMTFTDVESTILVANYGALYPDDFHKSKVYVTTANVEEVVSHIKDILAPGDMTASDMLHKVFDIFVDDEVDLDDFKLELSYFIQGKNLGSFTFSQSEKPYPWEETFDENTHNDLLVEFVTQPPTTTEALVRSLMQNYPELGITPDNFLEFREWVHNNYNLDISMLKYIGTRRK